MEAADRVLLTSLPGAPFVEQLARRVDEGAIVVLGPREALYEARKECAGLAHVLFVEGSRDEIPWAEAWFDDILDPQPDAPTAEMLRVLKPGGRILGLALPGESSSGDGPQMG
jgi:ubiquinone/menaquinone biosynthesis C-methylase UbiE